MRLAICTKLTQRAIVALMAVAGLGAQAQSAATPTSNATMEQTVAFISGLMSKRAEISYSDQDNGRWIISSENISQIGPCTLRYTHGLRQGTAAETEAEEQDLLLDAADPQTLWVYPDGEETNMASWAWEVELKADKLQPATKSNGVPSRFREVDKTLGYAADRSTAELMAEAYIHAIALCHSADADLEARSVRAMLDATAYWVGKNEQYAVYKARNAEEAAEDSSASARHSKALGFLNAMNTVLGAANEQMEQINAQQQAENDARWQQARDLVAANNARRGAEARQRANQPASASGIHPSSGTPAPLPTYPNTGTVKPPAPYQPPASSGGTVVATNGNSNICPADGWIMVTTGDVAVGHQCTPGQPVNASSSGNGGGGNTFNSGSGSGSNSGSSGGSPSGGNPNKIVKPIYNGCVLGQFQQDKVLPNRQDLWLNSRCALDVTVTWYLGNGLGQMASIHAWATVPASSFVYPGQSTKYSIYVCPTDHPIPVDNNGNQVTGPDQPYRCSKSLGNTVPPFLPF